MKNQLFSVFIFLGLSFNLSGQNQARIDMQTKLDKVLETLEKDTDSKFTIGSTFNFNEPYEAVFTKDATLSLEGSRGGESKEFKTGDTVLVLTALPIGALQYIKAKDSDDRYATRSFGRPGFEVIEKNKYVEQLTKIKAADWKTAQGLLDLLSCGNLESAGYPNLEKYYLTFGDTPVFFDMSEKDGRIIVSFNLQTYGGNDFKDLGPTKIGNAFIEVIFLDGETVKFDCVESNDDSRFAAIDITDEVARFQNGVKNLNFSLSKKASRDLSEDDAYSIGIKAECIKL